MAHTGYFYENGGLPVTSRKQRMFGLERDVEGEGKQCGVDGPRTVDGHLGTDTSGTLLSNLLKYLVSNSSNWPNYKEQLTIIFYYRLICTLFFFFIFN